ncbi:unnamed protein product [Pleuronectes platessa]|uniref:Uncharacterized protein n=1 Tax=Pleuronectes platessa TaxID=8262 RepID=A0A9N7UTS0_PLEPL|nr:unnamed protein product [Pleuronectes platessa]
MLLIDEVTGCVNISQLRRLVQFILQSRFDIHKYYQYPTSVPHLLLYQPVSGAESITAEERLGRSHYGNKFRKCRQCCPKVDGVEQLNSHALGFALEIFPLWELSSVMDWARGVSAGLMAGPRQPEETVLIIFASSLPSRLLPQCCTGISVVPTFPMLEQHIAKHSTRRTLLGNTCRL